MCAVQRVSTINVSNSIFHGNSHKGFGSNSEARPKLHGGAITAASAENLIIRNTQFVNNTGTNGGALMLFGEKRLSGIVHIANVSFVRNSVERYGGAIAILV